MGNGFNELEILSQRALIEETLIKLLDTYKELERREEVTIQFLKKLCGFNRETWVWFRLWESGSAHRFTDILQFSGCGRAKLARVLQKLLTEGLVRRVGMRYQAVSPAWLVRV